MSWQALRRSCCPPARRTRRRQRLARRARRGRLRPQPAPAAEPVTITYTELHLQRRQRGEPRGHRGRVRGREPRHHGRGHDPALRRLRHRAADRPRRRHRLRRVRRRVLQLRAVPGERRARPARGRRTRTVYRQSAARGLLDRWHPVRAAELVLDRRAVLQQGPVRRGRARLPDERLDLGRRAGGGARR